MKKVTINHSQLLFGALVVTLGLSKSWFYNTERIITGSRDLAQVAATSPVASAAAEVELIKELDVRSADGTTRKIFVKYENVSTATGPREVLVNGRVEIRTAEPRTVLQATFSDSSGCTTCVDVAPMSLQSIASTQQLASALQSHASNALKAKQEREKAERALQADLDSCKKKRDGETIIDLTKRENREERFKCLSEKLEVAEDDREAARKIHTAIGRDLIKLSQSRNPEDREQAITIAEELATKFEDNRYAKRYTQYVYRGAASRNGRGSSASASC